MALPGLVLVGLVATACANPAALLEADFFHDLDDTILTVGSHHACLIEGVEESEFGGEVVCWGGDEHGQASPPNVRCVAYLAPVKRSHTALPHHTGSIPPNQCYRIIYMRCHHWSAHQVLG